MNKSQPKKCTSKKQKIREKMKIAFYTFFCTFKNCDFPGAFFFIFLTVHCQKLQFASRSFTFFYIFKNCDLPDIFDNMFYIFSACFYIFSFGSDLHV